MLNINFYLPCNDILITQVDHAVVVSVCDCGCLTIDIRVPPNLERYTWSRIVPVEMIVEVEEGSAAQSASGRNTRNKSSGLV